MTILGDTNFLGTGSTSGVTAARMSAQAADTEALAARCVR
jgi:hypothetical protein